MRGTESYHKEGLGGGTSNMRPSTLTPQPKLLGKQKGPRMSWLG